MGPLKPNSTRFFNTLFPIESSFVDAPIIATDLGLGKPWEEKGKEEPDSLVEEQRKIRKRVQASAKPNHTYRKGK